MIFYLDFIVQMSVALLVLLQCLIVYFLPPEKAEKFNFIGKGLDFLVNTKRGFSPKDSSNGNNTKSDNTTHTYNK